MKSIMLYSFDSFSDTRLNVFDVETDHRSPLLLKLERERSFDKFELLGFLPEIKKIKL